MANPTGTQFLQANPNYVWADGDVYSIQGGNSGDTTEGAAFGASFGGLGVDNQPHARLLDKINYLKKNLVQATSQVGVTGWYKISSLDAILGNIQIIEQWGMIPASQVPPINPNNQATINFNFPLAFTTACWVILPYIAFNTSAPSSNFFLADASVLPIAPFGKTTNTLLVGWQATNATFVQIVYGVGWRALGY